MNQKVSNLDIWTVLIEKSDWCISNLDCMAIVVNIRTILVRRGDLSVSRVKHVQNETLVQSETLIF